MDQELHTLAINASGLFKPALEERSDGAVQKEQEIVYYALVNPEALPQTPLRERQEQWTIKIAQTDNNAAKGDIRVRKTDFYDAGDLGRTEYVLTTKVRDEAGDADEVPIPSTEDQFIHFKRLAESGMIKDRLTYKIDATELAWEVDLFVNPEGGFYPWVKIDLEVPSKDSPIPELPFETQELITAQNGERTPPEEAKVRELYETMFLTKNPGAKSQTAPSLDDNTEQDASIPDSTNSVIATEAYQEGEADSFTCFGKRYPINKYLAKGHAKATEMVDTDKLTWVLKYDTPDAERQNNADLKAPLLVTNMRGKLVTVDGLHRLSKAVAEGVTQLPCKIVELDEADVIDDTPAHVPAIEAAEFAPVNDVPADVPAVTPEAGPEQVQEETPAQEAHAETSEEGKEFTAAWPELNGKAETPELAAAEIFEGKGEGDVQSEPDETQLVVGTVEGTEAALEVIQEFNSQVEALAQQMHVRLVHMSLGQGYVSAADLYGQLAQKSPEKVAVSESGPFGNQFYMVKNPAPGAVIGGVGWHFNKPTLSSDQVQF